jgi:hypothetical protein
MVKNFTAQGCGEGKVGDIVSLLSMISRLYLTGNGIDLVLAGVLGAGQIK